MHVFIKMILLGYITIFAGINAFAYLIDDYLIDIKDNQSNVIGGVSKAESIIPNMTKIKNNLSNHQQVTRSRIIQIEVAELTDNQGLKYVGGKVSKVDLLLYLTEMEALLGDNFSRFRANQATRDHHTFHITLVNPYEIKALTKPLTLGEKFSFSLIGLGRAEKEQKTTYFIVAKSLKAQTFRQALGLAPKDFHITLGFDPQDVFGVDKDETSLIKPRLSSY